MMKSPGDLPEVHPKGGSMLYAMLGIQVLATCVQLTWTARSKTRIQQITDKVNVTVTMIAELKKERLLAKDSFIF